MISIGKEKAVSFYDTKWWENCTDQEIVRFQLFVEELCVPFSKFHEAVESVLDHAVFTHSFALNYGGIVSEFLKERSAPTEKEVVDFYQKWVK
jgi:hypothetical protein